MREFMFMRTVSKTLVFCRLGFFALAVFLFSGPHAVAWQYSNSKHPFWAVGSLNKSLSEACRRREFSQISQLRMTIGFHGKKGTATIGIAKMGWNLYDPRGLSQPGYTYHFFHDGYSDCRVYIAGSRLTR